MKRRLLFFALLVISFSAFPENHSGKTISKIHSGDTRNCVFFRLNGVSVADTQLPDGGPWFSVLRSHESFNEIFSMLLMARATGLALNVETNGSTNCDGHPAVTWIVIN